MDYCPVFNGFTNGMCSDPENEALIRVDTMERFGERNSRCISGYLKSTRRTAYCLRIACAVEDRSFHVQVDGTWRICSYKDQVLRARNGDRVICPDPVRVCPTFYCVRDCLGTARVCDYEKGKCICGNETMVACLEEDTSEGAPFFDPSIRNTTLPPVLDDSRIFDYYVPAARLLKDERRVDLDDWEIALISLGCAAVVAAVIFFLYRRMRRESDEEGGGGEVGTDVAGVPAIHNPNKDKMIATVVVDMRIRDPNLQADVLAERLSETDLSMTDSDRAGTIVSNLSSSEAPPSFGEDVQEVHIDPLAQPAEQPCVFRRRNVNDSHHH